LLALVFGSAMHSEPFPVIELAAMKKPPHWLEPGRPGGGYEPSAGCGLAADQCFGAVGLSCYGVIAPTGPFEIAGCIGEYCTINAGSWDHDECCFANPNGNWCGPQNAASGPACATQWARAIHRVSRGLSWQRKVNRCVHNRRGRVDFTSYCAPGGTVVASGDAAKCCSRRASPYEPQRDFLNVMIQGARLDGTFTPVVCEAEAGSMPIGNACTSDAQCAPGTSCFQGVCGAW
jgi:hypothetical protein